MSVHSIALLTRDGERLSFPCAEDQSLVEAAAAADLFLPVVCREGGCGACRATAQEGEYHLGPHSSAALSAEDAERRAILLCRTYPRGPMSVSAPFDRSRILSQAVRPRGAAVTELTLVGERTVRLRLELEDEGEGRAAEFEAGQYMELEIPGEGVRRAYSLANTANWDGALEFLIRLQPQGRFSSYLERRAKVGDRLLTHGPLGGFTLQEHGLRPRWFVAGGTGLAPMLSMLRRMADYQDPQPARLYFGVNRESELFALDDLGRVAEELPGFTLIPCVWQAGDGWQGFRGTPADAVRADLAALGVAPDLYTCGPPALIDAVERVAGEQGVPDSHLFSERFLPSVA
jgi:ferredoxin-NADP reductase/ferredoxin